jgi:hypothetical protein
MQDITTAAELRDAIQRLEEEHTEKGQQLKEQFFLTFESLKPVNLLRNTLDDVASSPFLINNIFGTLLELTAGFLSKKIFIGVSGSKFRNILGSILQFGVTNFVARHHDIIKSVGQSAFKFFFDNKQQTEKDRDG